MRGRPSFRSRRRKQRISYTGCCHRMYTDSICLHLRTPTSSTYIYLHRLQLLIILRVCCHRVLNHRPAACNTDMLIITSWQLHHNHSYVQRGQAVARKIYFTLLRRFLHPYRMGGGMSSEPGLEEFSTRKTYLYPLTCIYSPVYTYLYPLTCIYLPVSTYLYPLTCIYSPWYLVYLLRFYLTSYQPGHY